ncbi:DUF1800 family protein [Flavobacteriaceae bacterium]|nr:DUF1800 domain-containing protein [Flavobacteriaceae bacterium]MDC6469385.1 DUF1800 family protein [Flavobacteriaceae bacterium]
MNQEKNKNPQLDLVELFKKDNIDLKPILNRRKTRKHISGGIDKYSGEWGDKQKKHLLNRILIGYSKHHLDDLDNLNLDETIDLIFQQEDELPKPTNDYFYDWPQERYDELNTGELENKEYKVENVPPGETWVETAFPQNRGPWDQFNSLQAYSIKHQLRQKTSIHWKLSFFIHSLLPTPFDSGASAKAGWQYLELLFKAPFQSYKKTVIDISKDPNMLWYLNLQFSKEENPDENFAREIQELFTVGKGPNSKFTESDVKAFSKIFVGWQSDFYTHESPGRIKTRFEPWNHDTSDKQLSSFYGNKLIRGRQGQEGEKEFDELMDIIFENKEVSYHISRRLYQFFVYPEIDSSTENNIIEPMAKKFRDSNFSLIETLKLLLKSEHFFDVSNFNSMIKSPLEYTYGVLKFFNLHQEDFYLNLLNYDNNGNGYSLPEKYTNPLSREFYFYIRFTDHLEGQGCNFGNPPSVSGWPPYYQAPVYDLFWINSRTLSERAELANNFQYDLYIDNDWENDSYVKYRVDYVKIIEGFENPSDIYSVVNQFANNLITVEIGQDQINDLTEIILGSIDPSYYTELYNRYTENPTFENKNELNERFRQFTTHLLTLSENHVF